jgi:hypothetical protein
MEFASLDLNVLAILFERLMHHSIQLSAELIGGWHSVSP